MVLGDRNFMLSQAARRSLKLRAVQTPLPLSALNAVHYIPDRTKVEVEVKPCTTTLLLQLSLAELQGFA